MYDIVHGLVGMFMVRKTIARGIDRGESRTLVDDLQRCSSRETGLTG